MTGRWRFIGPRKGDWSFGFAFGWDYSGWSIRLAFWKVRAGGSRDRGRNDLDLYP